MKHPANIPEGAYWVGGDDGGIFLTVAQDRRRPDLYYCHIFDVLGEPESEGLFAVIAPEEPSLNLANPKLFSGWDGSTLFLSDGRTMSRTNLVDSAERR